MRRITARFLAAGLLALSLIGCTRAAPDPVDKEPDAKKPAVIQPQGSGEAMETRWLPPQEPVTAPVLLENGHAQLLPQSYYGRTLLEGEELELYERMFRAVDECRNFVEVEDLFLDREQFTKVYQYLVQDNPQFFYLSKSYKFRYYQSTPDRPIVIILNYFDGALTDDVAVDYSLTTQADRRVISRQRAELERTVQKILKEIPAAASSVEKERRAHDAVMDAVVYDNTGAEQLTKPGADAHSFTSYGALTGGLAVCEGYSEAFQYLLYRMGINSLVVVGESEGQPHQWNLVNLDGSYYHVDPTWDDTDIFAELGLRCYYYFNTSDEMILRDHTIGMAAGETGGYGYPIPPAPAADAYYYADRALVVDASGAVPGDERLREIMEGVADREADYLLLTFDSSWSAEQIKGWINATLWAKDGELPQALEAVDVRLDTAYYSVSKWSMALVPVINPPKE